MIKCVFFAILGLLKKIGFFVSKLLKNIDYPKKYDTIYLYIYRKF